MRGHRSLRISAAIAALVVTTIAGLLTAPAASAGAYGCDGTLIHTINHAYNDTYVATTYLYWDGTYNCAVAVKTGRYYGISTRMALELYNSTGAEPNHDVDDGPYKYYAGPVKVYGRNACIATELTMWDAKGYEMFQHRSPYSGYFHCG
jgi:hypothetical protein